jgi:alkylation response protein AidB-like acyl-CoA dehydrogenase
MNLSYDENQVMFKQTVARMLEQDSVASRSAQRKSVGGIDRQRWQMMAELGLFSLCLLESDGGIATSIFDMLSIADGFGAGASADSWLDNAMLPLSVLAACDAAPQDWLDPLLSGDQIASLAFAEPQGRYNPIPLVTRVTQKDGGFVLSGEKIMASAAAAADQIFVTARHGDSIVLCALKNDTVGMQQRPYHLIDGSHAAMIELHAVSLAADDVATLSRDKFERAIAIVKLMAMAEMTGLCERLLDQTLTYVRQREQFGQAIGRFQALQHRLVDCYVLVDQNRSLLCSASIALSENGPRAAAELAGAKAVMSENAIHIGHEAIQMHGGMGTTDELEISHMHKRILLLSRLFGDAASDLKQYRRAA